MFNLKPLAPGLTYGILVMALSILLGAGGHGFDVFFVLGGAPIAIASYLLPMRAPDSLEIVFALSVPILWPGIARLSTLPRRWPFLAAISLHYGSALWFALVHGGEDFEMRDASDKLRHFLPWIAAFLLVYVLGQLLLWRTFVKSSRRQLSSP